MKNYLDAPGQWIGGVTGTHKGTVVINIENNRKGRIAFLDSNILNPQVIANIQFKASTANKCTGVLSNFFAFHRPSALLERWDKVKHLYPSEYNFPSSGTVEAEVKESSDNGITIEGNWKTNIESSGNFFARYNLFPPRGFLAPKMSWDEFKGFVKSVTSSDPDDGYIYRGQGSLDYLRTTFHRTGRTDLIRYATDDVPILTHFINAVSNYKYNINDMSDFGALINLAQHHGYPTPLLDWTESPYVAAYFAFQGIPKKLTNGYVRIFVFNLKVLRSLWHVPGPFRIYDPNPIISIDKLPAYNNPRVLPQQAVVMFSNIDNIEGYISLMGGKEPLLHRIDIPISERNKVMKELQHMGITAGSLFPGIDGTCKALKERYF